MSPQELAVLLTPEARAWIAAHRDVPPYALAMRQAPAGLPAAVVIGQVALLQKAAAKLPCWARHGCILPARAYEQATSEALADAKPWQAGQLALDLSCGLGSDDRALSAHYASVVALEPDPVLAAVVRDNQSRMAIGNVSLLEQRAEDFLAAYDGPRFDLIYIDPDRRGADGKRQYALRDCEPDVLALLPRMQALGRRVLIKASPMLDLHAVEAELGQPAMLWVVAEGNECKELLIEIDTERPAAARGAIFLRKGAAHRFVGRVDAPVPEWPDHDTPAYILEADTALYKAGIAAAWYGAPAHELNGGMAGREGYFFARQDAPGFHGHRFKVRAMLPFKPAEIKKYCKSQGIGKLQYTRRNFDIPLEQVRQQVKVPEGGHLYLLLTKMGPLGRVALICERLADS